MQVHVCIVNVPQKPTSRDITVKSRFNQSRLNEKSQFKKQNLVTKMKFHLKKSQFSVESQFKE